MPDSRLEQQIQFILEIDRLKAVLRQTLTTAGRLENSSEHSWHMAVMAILLHEHANQPLDLLRVLKMILVHDIVEVDAGDTYCYDEQAAIGKEEREQQAANRLFGLLPPDQSAELRTLWDEFESRQTPESRFANALDRLQPVLLNYHTDGQAWSSHAVTITQVLARNHPIDHGSAKLWQYARGLIEEALGKGWLKE